MDDNTNFKEAPTRDRQFKMEDKLEKMKIKKVGMSLVALGLGVIIMALFFWVGLQRQHKEC